jgi:hypothetical protein
MSGPSPSQDPHFLTITGSSFQVKVYVSMKELEDIFSQVESQFHKAKRERLQAMFDHAIDKG